MARVRHNNAEHPEPDRHALARDVLRYLESIANVPNAAVFFFDADSGLLRVAAGTGFFDERRPGGALVTAIEPGRGLVGKCFVEKRPASVSEYYRWPGRIPDLDGALIRWAAASPITTERDGVVGVLVSAGGESNLSGGVESLVALCAAYLGLELSRYDEVGKLVRKIEHGKVLYRLSHSMRDRLEIIEKHAAIATCAAGIVHNFRNILTTIVARSEQVGLCVDMGRYDRLAKLSNDIRKACDTAEMLCRDILAIANPSPLVDARTSSTHDVRSVVDRTVRMFRPAF